MSFRRVSTSSIKVESATIAVSGTSAGSVSTTPTYVSATGGTTETFGVYKCHIFTSSGTLTIDDAPPEGALLEYVVVGSGGASGSTNAAAAGPGGGGGVLAWFPGANTSGQCIGPAFLVKKGQVITVSVAGQTTTPGVNNSQSYPGSSSYFDNGVMRVTTNGGGGGGAGYNLQGLPSNGASGGAVGASVSTTFGATGPYPYQPGITGPYKQGNPNNGTSTTGKGAGGACTPPGYYTTNRAAFSHATSGYSSVPGLPYRLLFSSTYMELGPAGTPSWFPLQTAAVDSTYYGGGGGPGSANGRGGYGGQGIVMFRYYTKSIEPAVQGMELLVVAGGSGAQANGSSAVLGRGGGAAGGLLYFGAETAKTANGPALNVPSGTYTIIVGAGSQLAGNNSAFVGLPADNLKNCEINSFGARCGIVANGGSRHLWQGGDYCASGAGGSTVSPAGGGMWIAGDPKQGNDGGAYVTYCGGGGGAGGAGGNGSATKGGDGGPGLQYSISGAPTFYAAGGGGFGSTTLASRGIGGSGIGGTAANVSGQAGTNGATNTGSGGGGDYSVNASAGGSGIVILRYPDSYPAATATTGSPTITLAGGWRTYIFTSSGTITF